MITRIVPVIIGLLLGIVLAQTFALFGMHSALDAWRKVAYRSTEIAERGAGVADEWQLAAIRYEASAKACVVQLASKP